MSRYYASEAADCGLNFSIEYGHDHACGYFAQVYLNYDIVCEQDEFSGFIWCSESGTSRHSHTGEVATMLAQKWFDKCKNKQIEVERMDRDPKNHLGARIAQMLKDQNNV